MAETIGVLVMTLGGLAGPTAASTATLVAVGTTVISTVASFAISELTKLMTPKQQQSHDLTARDPVASWKVIYGTTRVGGTPVAMFLTANAQHANMVMVHGSGKIHAMTKMLFEGVQVPIDGNGDCPSGQYYSKAHWECRLGAESQTAYAGLMTVTSDMAMAGNYRPDRWLASDQGNGLVHSWVTLVYDNKAYPNGQPNITWEVQGREIYDLRSSTTGYSNNSALCLLDYLTNTTYGLGCPMTEIDSTSFIAAANVCDETITLMTLPTWQANHAYTQGDAIRDLNGNLQTAVSTATSGSSTPSWVTSAGDFTNDGSTLRWACGGPRATSQPRYTTNGIIDTSKTPLEIIQALLQPMGAGAWLVWSGGTWKLYPSAYRTPSLTLTDADVRGEENKGLTYQTRTGRRDLYNAIKGTFIAPENKWQAADIPAVMNGKYIAEDSGYSNVVDRGAWATATLFYVNDALINRGAAYICTSQHTSASGTEPGAGASWATVWALCTEIHWKDVTYDMVTDAARARRLAKLDLERGRRMGMLQMPSSLAAIQATAADVVTVSHPNFNDARTNLLTYSEVLENAVWNGSNYTVQANATTAPNGLGTADQVTTTNTLHSIRQLVNVVAGQTYTFSWWAQLGTMSTLKYSVWNMTGGGNIIAATTYAATSSWQRFSCTFTVPGGCTQVAVYPLRDSGVTGTAFVWGAQMVVGSAMGSYLPTYANAVATADTSWNGKQMEVMEHVWGVGKDSSSQPVITVELMLRETDANVYAWSSTEEKLVVLPESSLPSDYTAAPVDAFDNTNNITSVDAPISPSQPPTTWDSPTNPFNLIRDELISESIDMMQRAISTE